jgi:hypothetical protein
MGERQRLRHVAAGSRGRRLQPAATNGSSYNIGSERDRNGWFFRPSPGLGSVGEKLPSVKTLGYCRSRLFLGQSQQFDGANCVDRFQEKLSILSLVGGHSKRSGILTRLSQHDQIDTIKSNSRRRREDYANEILALRSPNPVED